MTHHLSIDTVVRRRLKGPLDSPLLRSAPGLPGPNHPIRRWPGGLVNAAGTVAGDFMPPAKDVAAMVRWFDSGNCVADTTSRRAVFGEVPTAEEAIARFVRQRGH